MQETWVWSLGREDPGEKGMATHSFSCLENSMGRRAWQATGIGSQRIRRDWGTVLFYDTFTSLVKPQSYVHEVQVSLHTLQRLSGVRKEEIKTEDWLQQKFHFFREKKVMTKWQHFAWQKCLLYWLPSFSPSSLAFIFSSFVYLICLIISFFLDHIFC